MLHLSLSLCLVIPVVGIIIVLVVAIVTVRCGGRGCMVSIHDRMRRVNIYILVVRKE